MALPVRFEVIGESLETPFRDDFPNYTDGLVRGAPGGFVLTPVYAKHAGDIYGMALRSDDAWVVTFPKCGTTWTQEMVWLVTHDCDFEGAKAPLGIRSPFLEFPYLRPESNPDVAESEAFMEVGGGVAVVDRLASPRVIKSHLPLHLLPPKLLDTCKVVYVARNPKDVIVSFYHHHKLIKFHEFKGDVARFADYFMKGLIYFAPFFTTLLEAWNLRHHPNLLFLFYEDLKRDLRGGIKRVGDFLQKPLTDEQLTRLTEHLRFDNFSRNEAVNFEIGKQHGFMNDNGRFCRKGKTGDWKNYIDAETNEHIDRWIETNLAGSDLKFVTELDQQD